MISQKILVTGGAGYIGSHTVLRLLELGYDVVVFDSLECGHIENVDTLRSIRQNAAHHPNFEFVKGDLKNFADISGVFELHKDISAVIHFAAYICVEESVKDPEKYYLNNVGGSLNLLKAMRSNGVDKIVFSSTAAVYGNPVATTQPLAEDSILAPINPYGKSKLMVENILRDFGAAYGTNSVILRYFNVAGADSLARIGEWHEPETHLIPKILAAAMSDTAIEPTEAVFKIFGDDFGTPDGTCVRDYVNVEDLAEAHLKALEYLCDNCTRDCQMTTSCFNIGTNTGNSVKEVLDKCESVLGKKIERKVLSRRAGDPAFLVANTKKAQKVLGWSSKKSLKDSISSAYEWYKFLRKKIKKQLS